MSRTRVCRAGGDLRGATGLVPALLTALGGAMGCSAAAEEVDEATSAHESPILGSFAVDGSCTPTQRVFFEDAMFVARTVVGSEAFEECVRARVASQYRRCTFSGGQGDPNLTVAEHTANALNASRSVNDLQAGCDGGSTAWGYAGVGSSPAYYGTERFTFARAAMNQAAMIGRPACGPGQSFATHGCRDSPYPFGLREVAATVIHENMHQHGYTHGATGRPCVGAGYVDGIHSMPWLVDQCAANVIERSMTTCGDICPTRSGDDITSCRSRGRLKLVRTLGSSACVESWDPGLGHIGALQLVDGKMTALDMLPHGQYWGGIGSAPNRTNDIFKAKGDFDPFTPGEEMLFDWVDGVNRGWRVVAWDVNNTSLGDRTGLRATRRFGERISHGGDGGTGTWLLYNDNVILGVGRYSGAASWPGSRARDELFVRDPNGFGVLAVSGNFVTRNVMPWGTVLAGAGGGWTVGAGDRFLGQGDFDGNGQTDIVLRNATRIAIISRTGAGGTFRTLDARSIDGDDGWWGYWNVGTADQIVATGNFVGDARDEILIKSPWGLGLLGIPAGATSPRDLWGARWGTTISGVWTLRESDWFSRPGNFYAAGTRQILVRGTDGLATLRWSGSPVAASIPATQHMRPSGQVWPALGGSGFWAYGHTTNQILEQGDFDGDGFDQFVIRSGWGIGVIGRTRSSTSMYLHDANRHDCGPAGEVACHNALFGSWLSRETDRVVTSLDDGAGADSLILRGFQ